MPRVYQEGVMLSSIWSVYVGHSKDLCIEQNAEGSFCWGVGTVSVTGVRSRLCLLFL